MGFHNKDGVLTTDGTIEEEILYLCESYPGIKVFAGHNRRASSALVYFFANLPLEKRKELSYTLDHNKWKLRLDNGSVIRFISFNNPEKLFYPKPPIHVFIAYGIVNYTHISNSCASLRKYEGKTNHWHKDLFPMFYDKPRKNKDGFLFTGEDFFEEYKRLKEKAEYEQDVLGRDTFYRPDNNFIPDINPYESALNVEKVKDSRIASLEHEIEELKKLMK